MSRRIGRPRYLSSTSKTVRERHDRCQRAIQARIDDALENPSKAEIREMLAEAARNTAALETAE